jgi:hypothetical protein
LSQFAATLKRWPHPNYRREFSARNWKARPRRLRGPLCQGSWAALSAASQRAPQSSSLGTMSPVGSNPPPDMRGAPGLSRLAVGGSSQGGGTQTGRGLEYYPFPRRVGTT